MNTNKQVVVADAELNNIHHPDTHRERLYSVGRIEYTTDFLLARMLFQEFA